MDGKVSEIGFGGWQLEGTWGKNIIGNPWAPYLTYLKGLFLTAGINTTHK